MYGKSIIRETIQSSPKSPGVYRMIDKDDKVLYVGKAKSLPDRLSSYLNLKQLPTRLKRMVFATDRVEIIATSSESEALLLEANLIKTLKPLYNIRLRDDKSFPYIFIAGKTHFPAISKVRKKIADGHYFGPFASSYDATRIIELLKKSFLIRTCSDAEFKNRSRPCLEYHIKKCSAPCVNYITKTEYKKSITEALTFLSGKNNNICENLISEMQKYSSAENYEKAAQIRDRIKAINSILAKQSVTNLDLDNFDVISIAENSDKYAIVVFFYRNGISYGNERFFPKTSQDNNIAEVLSSFLMQFYSDHPLPDHLLLNLELNEKAEIAKALSQLAKKNVKINNPKYGNKKEFVDFATKNAKLALERKLAEKESIQEIYYNLKEVFGLYRIPKKIEVYDNSHILGEYAVGAMVAVSQKGFLKQNYRKFNIKYTDCEGDDYAMLKEVLLRRFSRLIAEDKNNQNGSWPDIIFLDGGKGHASIAKEVFDFLEIPDFPFFCIAKGKERNKGKERFCNDKRDYFNISDKKLLYYLQKIRDEVHRFAITTHRNKRSKALSQSKIDEIPGIGPHKKKMLLNYFGSVAKISAAACEDLEKTPGISKKLAQEIYSFLH